MSAVPVRYKYPRTPHLPHSPGATSDDKWLTAEGLATLGRPGQQLVVTEKMDGGNVTMARDYFHARSPADLVPAWEGPAKARWAQLAADIPAGWRLSAESMWARRAVCYVDLPDVVLLIGVWDADNCLLAWDATVEWAGLLGLSVVPVLYRGADLAQACAAWRESGKTEEASEGYVVRVDAPIPYRYFGENVAKYVRAQHVRSAASWRHRDDFPVNSFAPKELS